MPPVELLALLVRNLYQEVEHGRIFPLVHFVHPVLASRFAGGRALPRSLANYLAVPHPRYRGAWRVCTARRAIFPASTGSAWPARDLSRANPQALGVTQELDEGAGAFSEGIEPSSA